MRPIEAVYSTAGEKTMQDNYRNICKIARETAERTQERFAEMIGVSVEAVRQYEADKIMPSDEVVTRMIEVSGMPVLGYWHLLNKSRVASELLPEVERLPLPQAVILAGGKGVVCQTHDVLHQRLRALHPFFSEFQ